jgi:hypothetical protein
VKQRLNRASIDALAHFRPESAAASQYAVGPDMAHAKFSLKAATTANLKNIAVNLPTAIPVLIQTSNRS